MHVQVPVLSHTHYPGPLFTHTCMPRRLFSLKALTTSTDVLISAMELAIAIISNNTNNEDAQRQVFTAVLNLLKRDPRTSAATSTSVMHAGLVLRGHNVRRCLFTPMMMSHFTVGLNLVNLYLFQRLLNSEEGGENCSIIEVHATGCTFCLHR